MSIRSGWRMLMRRTQLVVWCGIWRGTVLGPFFLEDESVTSVTIFNMLSNQLWPHIQHAVDGHTWIQLDGASVHAAYNVRAWLDTRFPGRWIGRGGPVQWPPRSPDLNPLDFYLWGYLKHVVYANRPENLNSLKNAIAATCAAIPHEVLHKVCSCWVNRLHLCVAERGQHFEHLL
jgi:hypothetical protein